MPRRKTYGASNGYTRRGNPVRLEAPRDIGDYELRYLTGENYKTLGKLSLHVTPGVGCREVAGRQRLGAARYVRRRRIRARRVRKHAATHRRRAPDRSRKERADRPGRCVAAQQRLCIARVRPQGSGLVSNRSRDQAAESRQAGGHCEDQSHHRDEPRQNADRRIATEGQGRPRGHQRFHSGDPDDRRRGNLRRKPESRNRSAACRRRGRAGQHRRIRNRRDRAEGNVRAVGTGRQRRVLRRAERRTAQAGGARNVESDVRSIARRQADCLGHRERRRNRGARQATMLVRLHGAPPKDLGQAKIQSGDTEELRY